MGGVCWTADELVVLTELYGGLPQHDIALMLGIRGAH